MGTAMHWRLRIKFLIAACLYYSGLLHLLINKRLNGKGVVLMYHRILTRSEADDSFSSEGIIVSPDNFARHLACLKRYFQVLDLATFQAWIRGGKTMDTDKPIALITFDDGWFDNHERAHPVIAAAGLPVTLFVATDYPGTNKTFWQEHKGQLVCRLADDDRAEVKALLAELGMAGVEHLSGLKRKTEVAARVRRLKKRDPDEVIKLLDQLKALAAPNDAPQALDRYMSWQEVRELADNGWTIASHGCSHRVMDRLSEADLNEEMHQSRSVLQQELGQPLPTTVLAYPNGNFNEAVIQAARKAGYDLAFTTEPGPVSPGDEPLTVKRINMQEAPTRSDAMFLCRLVGVF